jgi:hypothetical protein
VAVASLPPPRLRRGPEIDDASRDVLSLFQQVTVGAASLAWDRDRAPVEMISGRVEQPAASSVQRSRTTRTLGATSPIW